MSVAFTDPPVSEVVVATYFSQPIADFRTEHVGLFWRLIKSRFPTATQQLPVGITPPISPAEPLPMPRYWFTEADEIHLMQIQKNAFIFNWRRREESPYPRFTQSIRPSFDSLLTTFESFLHDELSIPHLSIDLCELTYVNTIDQSDYWDGPLDTCRVIPTFTTLSNFQNATLSDFNYFYTYSVATDLQLGITVRTAREPNPPHKPALILELKASTRLGSAPKSRAHQWFERAHDAVFRCFVDITARDIQDTYWGRRDEIQQ